MKKKGGCAKKGHQKNVGVPSRQKKSRGAANLRSAPGGRHPSYATEHFPIHNLALTEMLAHGMGTTFS